MFQIFWIVLNCRSQCHKLLLYSILKMIRLCEVRKWVSAFLNTFVRDILKAYLHNTNIHVGLLSKILESGDTYRKRVPIQFRFPKSIGTTGFPLRKSAGAQAHRSAIPYNWGRPKMCQVEPRSTTSLFTFTSFATTSLWLVKTPFLFCSFVLWRTTHSLWSFNAQSGRETCNLSTLKVAINEAVILNMGSYI